MNTGIENSRRILRSMLLIAVLPLAPALTAAETASVAVNPPSHAFLAAVQGCVFSSRPAKITREGRPLGYRGDDLIWINAVRGGYAPSDYPYCMFRPARSGNAAAFDIVFFNQDGIGFYVPVSGVTMTSAQALAFSFDRNSGGGEAARRHETLQFELSWEKSPPDQVAATIVSKATSRQLMIRQEQNWSARLQLPRADAPPTAVAKAMAGAVEFPASAERPSK